MYAIRVLGLAVLFGMSPLGARGEVSPTTTAFDIESSVLGETRRVLVRLPEGHEPGRPYPTVYVLDADGQFEWIAAYLGYMARQAVYPPVIVTGVLNVNRNRDFVPRADANYPDTGEAARFLRFVKDEWVPRIEADHGESSGRVIVGHSFGGVFAMYALFSAPGLFDATIALGTSAWVGDGVLMEQARSWFDDEAPNGQFVYMAVGENDGGPTVPSSRDLAALFELHAPNSLDWQYVETPRTEHFLNVVSGGHGGFMALFPSYGFDDELLAAARAGGREAVDAWFQDKEESLGWRFVPSWFDLGVAAMQVAPTDVDAALAITSSLLRHHPDHANAMSFHAGVLSRAGRHEEAVVSYQRAIALVESQGLHPNRAHLDSLRQGLARAQAVATP